jgi:hypothetical protein
MSQDRQGTERSRRKTRLENLKRGAARRESGGRLRTE